MVALVIIVALLVLMWALLIRPQRRRQAAQANMLADLAIGDEVLTAGGIYGRVDGIEADEVTLEIAPGTTIRVAKRAVAAVIEEEEEEEQEEEDEAEPEEAEDEELEESSEDESSAEKPTVGADERG
jgi:preprotein translocase subunit YajC